MKKLMSAMALSISTIMTAGAAFAADEPVASKAQGMPHQNMPQNHAQHMPEHAKNTQQRMEHRDEHRDQHQKNLERHQQERDKHRVKAHQPAKKVRPSQDWLAGYKYPSEYRGPGYRADYRQYPKLQKPGSNQRWYHVNGDYVLVNTVSQTIIKVIPGRE